MALILIAVFDVVPVGAHVPDTHFHDNQESGVDISRTRLSVGTNILGIVFTTNSGLATTIKRSRTRSHANKIPVAMS